MGKIIFNLHKQAKYLTIIILTELFNISNIWTLFIKFITLLFYSFVVIPGTIIFMMIVFGVLFDITDELIQALYNNLTIYIRSNTIEQDDASKFLKDIWLTCGVCFAGFYGAYLMVTPAGNYCNKTALLTSNTSNRSIKNNEV